MRRIIAIDPVSQRAIVEPGVTNLAVSKAAQPFGYFYAPDPSSQMVCSVGGNVAENSGGAHCLKHGFTVHHVTGLQIVTPQGELTWLGDGTGAAPGYDLLGAFTGSEGTLGIVTKIVVKLTRIPQAVTTLLAAFETTGAGGAAVSAIIGAGILPAAIEMMDALAIEAAEAAVACNYPAGAGAVLIVELDGPEADVRRDSAAVRALCQEAGCSEIREAADPAERAAIWAGPQVRVRRRGPDQPGLHRPGRRRAAHRPAARCSTGSPSCRRRPASGSPTCSTPATATCTRWCSTTTPRPAECEAAEKLSGAILDLCIEHGGSITGEHGVGVDKSRYMPKMFGADDLDTMQLLRCAFDPAGLCNPGKIFPTPRLCGEVPGVAARRASAGRRRRRRSSSDEARIGRARSAGAPMTTDTIPGALALACRAVRPAGPRGRGRRGRCRPRWPRPASVEEASAVLRAAADHDLAVVPRGGGTKLAWGAPPRRCDLVIDTLRLDRVLEHAAGDLVARVQAGRHHRRSSPGCSARAGRQLALDLPGSGGPAGRNGSPTIGGVLATGTAGPRRLRYGTPVTWSSGSPWSAPTGPSRGRGQGRQERRRLRPRQAVRAAATARSA